MHSESHSYNDEVQYSHPSSFAEASLHFLIALVLSGENPPWGMGCRAEIWTRACLTAGQRTTNWADEKRRIRNRIRIRNQVYLRIRGSRIRTKMSRIRETGKRSGKMYYCTKVRSLKREVQSRLDDMEKLKPDLDFYDFSAPRSPERIFMNTWS
jgi:hypothetical protein